MTTRPRTVRANRALYANALADAIDWTESFLATHDGQVRGQGCCDRGKRCEAYRKDAEKLVRYRKAFATLTGPQPINDALATARAVPIHELPLNDRISFPGVEG